MSQKPVVSIDDFLLTRFECPLHQSQITALHDFFPAKFDVDERFKFLLMQSAVAFAVNPLQFLGELRYFIRDVIRRVKLFPLQVEGIGEVFKVQLDKFL